MKVTYEKPALNVVDLKVNDSIAAGCTIIVKNLAEESCQVNTLPGFKENPNLFTREQDCKEPVDAYCEFTSNSGDNSSFAFAS